MNTSIPKTTANQTKNAFSNIYKDVSNIISKNRNQAKLKANLNEYISGSLKNLNKFYSSNKNKTQINNTIISFVNDLDLISGKVFIKNLNNSSFNKSQKKILDLEKLMDDIYNKINIDENEWVKKYCLSPNRDFNIVNKIFIFNYVYLILKIFENLRIFLKNSVFLKQKNKDKIFSTISSYIYNIENLDDFYNDIFGRKLKLNALIKKN